MRWLFRFVVAVLASLSAAVLLFIAAAHIYSRHIVEYQYEMVGWPAASAFKEPVEWKPNYPDRVRILAIHGGGMLGLADVELLKEFERRSGKKIYELFDFVAGTSTGAIVTTLLLYPDAQTKEPLSAAEVAEKYVQLGAKIMSAPVHHTLLTGNGLFAPRKMNHARILSSEDIFHTGTFRELVRPAMFPAFSAKEDGLKMFHNWHQDQANMFLAPLVSAVTSAPTYFPAVLLTGEKADGDFIGDAALIMNAPGDIAYLHARSNVPDAKQFVVVSVGTHRDFDVTDYMSVRGGILQWLHPLLGMIYDGEDRISSLSLERRRLYDPGIDLASYDFEIVVPTEVSSFSASPENVALIQKSGQDAARKQSEQINEILDILTNPNAKLPKQTAVD